MHVRCDSCNEPVFSENILWVGDNCYHKECFKKLQRRVVGAVVLAILLVGYALTGHADNIFPVGKPFPEQAIYCGSQKAAEAVAEAEGDAGFVGLLIRDGNCFIGAGMATYIKQVKAGKFSVWEVQIGDIKVFAPTSWKPAGDI